MTLLHETRFHNSIKLGWQFVSLKPIKIGKNELGQKAWGTESCKIGTFALPDENCVEDVKPWYFFAENTKVKGHPWGWRIEPDHLIVETYFVISKLSDFIETFEKTPNLDINTKSKYDSVLKTGLNFNKEFFKEPSQSNNSAPALKVPSNSEDRILSLKSSKLLLNSATDIKLEDHLEHLGVFSDSSHSKPSTPFEFDVLDSTKDNPMDEKFFTQISNNETIPDMKSNYNVQDIANFVASSYINDETESVNSKQKTIIKETLNSSKLKVEEANGSTTKIDSDLSTSEIPANASKETLSIPEKSKLEDISIDSSSQNLKPRNFADITEEKVHNKPNEPSTVDDMLIETKKKTFNSENDANPSQEMVLATDRVGHKPIFSNLDRTNSNLKKYNDFSNKIQAQQPVVDKLVATQKLPTYANGELDSDNFSNLYKDSKIPYHSEETLYKDESRDPEHVTEINIPIDFINLNPESTSLPEFGIAPDYETVPVSLDYKFLRMKEKLIIKCKMICANIGWNWTKVLQNIKCKLCYMFGSDILKISDSIQHSLSSE